MTETGLKAMAISALEEMKAEDISVMDVINKTSVTDWVIVASGTSSRHVKSAAGYVVEQAKKNGTQPLGVEGGDTGEWVLVDLGDVVVHVMQKEVRSFYDLESLWRVDARQREEKMQQTPGIS